MRIYTAKLCQNIGLSVSEISDLLFLAQARGEFSEVFEVRFKIAGQRILNGSSKPVENKFQMRDSRGQPYRPQSVVRALERLTHNFMLYANRGADALVIEAQGRSGQLILRIEGAI